MNKKLKLVRQALADYMYAEGCSCCRNEEAHVEAAKRLAELLEVPPYEDSNAYQFYMFRTGAGGPGEHTA